MKAETILAEIKSRLLAVYGKRLRRVILYGSVARGDDGPESDIDVLVLLEEPIDLGQDLETNLDALFPLALALDRRISAKPVSADEFQHEDCPLYESARREGIAA